MSPEAHRTFCLLGASHLTEFVFLWLPRCTNAFHFWTAFLQSDYQASKMWKALLLVLCLTWLLVEFIGLAWNAGSIMACLLADTGHRCAHAYHSQEFHSWGPGLFTLGRLIYHPLWGPFMSFVCFPKLAWHLEGASLISWNVFKDGEQVTKQGLGQAAFDKHIFLM